MGSVLVIGGGAAGLAAAIAAAECGDTVAVAEKMDRVGKKILATGNGRCNLTNTGAAAENYHGENADFVRSRRMCCLTAAQRHRKPSGSILDCGFGRKRRGACTPSVRRLQVCWMRSACN